MAAMVGPSAVTSSPSAIARQEPPPSVDLIAEGLESHRHPLASQKWVCGEGLGLPKKVPFSPPSFTNTARANGVLSPRKPMVSFAEETVPEAECVVFMKLALEQAKLALDSLEVPVGCVIVEDQKVISSGRNRTTETRNLRNFIKEGLQVHWRNNGNRSRQPSKKLL